MFNDNAIMLYDAIENLLDKYTPTEIENTIKEVRESAKERELEKYREATAKAVADYLLFLLDGILDPNTDYDEYYDLIMNIMKESEKELKQINIFAEADNLKKKKCKCGGQCGKNTTGTKDKSDEEVIDAFLYFLKNQTTV